MRNVRPTRRGLTVAAVAVAGLVMGLEFGGRSLDSVVVPAAALFAVGALVIARAREPAVTRTMPDDGYVGESIHVEIDVEVPDGTTAVVRNEFDAGATADGVVRRVGSDGTVAYSVALAERGVYRVDPIEITLRDVFGLWERRSETGDAQTVVAFPRIYPLRRSGGLLSGYVGVAGQRDEFDGLREYRPGDALRDVNWKASAKRADDLVVTEYAGTGTNNTVLIGVAPPGTGDRDADDDLAEAAASLADHLLDAGVAVGVATPDERVDPSHGVNHRRQILTALARFDGSGDGVVDADADATVRTSRDGDRVRIEVEDASHTFDDLVATGREGAPA